jgi:UDP:flavonoid glycosyltransferase YjiC (YdhE family)
MRAVLCAYGTMGNVLPFIGLGRALRTRGHQVTLVGPASLSSLADREQLEFVQIQEPTASGIAVRSGLVSKIRFLQTKYETALRGFCSALTPLLRQRDTVVAAPFWITGARLACELHRIPLATVYLQPRMLLDDSDRSILRPLRKAGGRLVRSLANRVMARKLNSYRRELGLPPVRKPLEWWNSPDAVLAFFPEWYSPKQPIWPAQLQHVGFPLFDHWDAPYRSEELNRFLAAGAPPLVFAQSSNAKVDRDYIAISIEAAFRLNRRAVFLTTLPEQLPNPLPSHVGYFGIVPLSVILPRSAAFIHHGGVGSLSQALAAGVPQLTIPKILDQFDNCRWLSKLGVSRQLKAREYRVDRVVTELNDLLQSPTVKRACQEFARRIPADDPFGQACEQLERISRSPSLTSC